MKRGALYESKRIPVSQKYFGICTHGRFPCFGADRIGLHPPAQRKHLCLRSCCRNSEQASLIFRHLHEHDLFRNMPMPDFIDHITDFYCDTNYLHPFREGNGRVQRVFLSQLMHNAGYDINFSHMDTDLLMIATIQASQGIYD